MDTPLTIHLGQLAQELHLPIERVQRTVELLDDGNTIPFITRYRREQTGGLDEEQIRLIAEEVQKRRQLLERKNTILKTIEAQGKLTPELRADIEHAPNLKRLEDLYLPYKVKKRSLATQARERGLEPLALAILQGEATDLETQAAAFVNPEKELPTTTEVLEGVQHIVAEILSERADLRGRLRRIFFRAGRLISTKIEKPLEAAPLAAEPDAAPAPMTDVPPAAENDASTAVATEPATGDVSAEAMPAAEAAVVEAGVSQADVAEAAAAAIIPPAADAASAASAEVEGSEQAASLAEIPAEPVVDNAATLSAQELAAGRLFEKPSAPVLAPVEQKKKKKKKKKLADSAFKDYFQFQEPLAKLPPHRILAINRGERANVLRVKIESDTEAMLSEAEQVVIAPQHPHGAFLFHCLKDALTRLLVPSLEREARRELSERSESHAVEVFIRNLRKLLLQPPVRGRRVLAIDPGYKSGCKMAAVDEWGNVLGHGLFYVVGRDDRREKAKQRMVEMVRKYHLSAIAIGNGTASRDVEQIVADALASELQGHDVAYVTVNEAGASVYSTSPLGREELPAFDAILRSAVSIGRRLLDPLSELVKINPANIGVGLYQHDMKAKHLKESLDAVVESCVNFVGVDVNTASPALLRYVSGLNALTARRIYDYRREHGPFRTREALRQVPGIGEATFVQAAGFLKILGGDNPLDATWIHPESYHLARQLLEKFGSSVEELSQAVPAPVVPPVLQVPKKFGEGLVAESTVAAEGAADDSLDQAAQGGIQTAEAILTAALNETPSDDAIATHMPGLHDLAAGDAAAEDSAETVPASSIADNLAPQPLSAELGPSSPVAPAVDEALAQAEQGGIQTEEAIVTAALNETASDDAIATHMPQGLVTEHESVGSGTEEPVAPPVAAAPKVNPIAEKLAAVDVPAVAAELGASPILLSDILTSLLRPGRDPREELPPPVFRRGIMKLDDLVPGMELQGTVLNVVDFGAFVDIGLSDSGLVHISRLADRFIRDPHEVVGVGDILKLWVVEVDRNRRRVSLTAIEPGTERPQRPRREDMPAPPAGNRPPRREGSGQRPPRGAAPAGGPPAARRDGPPPVSPPPGSGGGGGRPPRERDRRPAGGGGGGPPREKQPRVVERPPSKPKVVKPLTKAQQEGRAPLRSFSDLMQLMDKDKDKPKDKKPEAPPEGT